MPHFCRNELRLYLKKKNEDKIIGEADLVKNHLDNCQTCWAEWNKLRWDLAKNSDGFKELQDYLGKTFKWYLDASCALAKEWKKGNPKTLREIEEFYKHSKNYLYSLTLWHESGDRKDYLKDFKEIDRKLHINSCLDYGCGIGSDGLKMLELGKKVFFYDFDNPSTKFLKWRLEERKENAKLFFVGKVRKFPDVEAVWAIDVLEHMVDPTEIFKTITDSTKTFVHESRFGDKAGGRHPFHFEFNTQILNRELLKRNFVLDESFGNLNVWIRK